MLQLLVRVACMHVRTHAARLLASGASPLEPISCLQACRHPCVHAHACVCSHAHTWLACVGRMLLEAHQPPQLARRQAGTCGRVGGHKSQRHSKAALAVHEAHSHVQQLREARADLRVGAHVGRGHAWAAGPGGPLLHCRSSRLLQAVGVHTWTVCVAGTPGRQGGRRGAG